MNPLPQWYIAWDPKGSTTGIHDSPLGSTKIHFIDSPWSNDPLPGTTRITQWDRPGYLPPGSTNGNHKDPLHEFTKVHYQDPQGSTAWIRQGPPLRSTRIHHLDPPCSATRSHQDPLCGFARIHNLDSQGSTTWIHQDPPLGSTKIHHVDQSGHKHNLQGSPIWIRKNVIHQD